MTKQILQIIASLVFGYSIYFGHITFVTGMNPAFIGIFGFILLLQLGINILLIKRINKKIYAIVIFFLFGILFPLFLSYKSLNQVNPNAPPARIYYHNEINIP